MSQVNELLTWLDHHPMPFIAATNHAARLDPAALRRFERDAWVDAFTDTTWHLGGTNYKGWQIVGQYAMDNRAVLGLRLTSSRNLDDGARTSNATTGAVESSFSNAPLKIDVLQLDLSTRF